MEQIMYGRKHATMNFTCYLIINLIFQMSTNSELNDESYHEDWDKVELTLEWWDLLLRHLHCMIILKALPGNLPICLSDLINGGPAYYREQVFRFNL